MNEKPLKILGLCGSLRKSSLNMMALELARELMPQGMDLTIAEFGDIPIYNQDLINPGMPDSVNRLSSQIREHDAVLIATPEYNFSIPGFLKNAIDWVSRTPDQPFNNKPVAILSASMGPLGGARVQYDLRKVMLFLNANVLIKPEVFIGAAHTKFTPGTPVTDEATRKFLAEQMAAFQVWINRMKI